MSGIDWYIPCPYCNRASGIWTGPGGTLSHYCHACGYREISPAQAIIAWARDERRAGELIAAGVRSTAGSIEPMFMEDHRWYGEWTREPKHLEAPLGDSSDRFAGEAGA